MDYTYDKIEEKVEEIIEEKVDEIIEEKVEEKIEKEIKEKIKEDLLDILVNCVNDKKREVILPQKTKDLRKKFTDECEISRNKIVNMIEQIKLFRENSCVSDEQKEYAEEIETQAIFAIERLILYKWIKEGKTARIEFWTDKAFKKWKKTINKLKDENGKILNAGEICKIIETQLFYNCEITHKNHFYGYFTNPDYTFQNKENEDDLEGLCYESIEESKHIVSVISFSKMQDKELSKLPIEPYKKEWITYYKSFADARNIYSEEAYENKPFDDVCRKYKSIKHQDATKDNIEKQFIFEQYLDGFMISEIAMRYGMSGAYIWGVENWIKEKVDAKTKGFRAYIIDRISLSSEIMKHWLLFPLLDKLVADDLTIEQHFSANTREETKYCVNGNDLLERNVKDILKRTNIFYYANNKQVRKCDNVSEVNNYLYDEKREYWTVYEHQKLCLDYLLDDNDGKRRILFLSKSKSTRNNQSFSNIKRYFEEIFQYKKSEQDTYMAIYYLNQFVHFDSAVELIYGISKVMKITQNSAQNLKEEIVNLANEVVRLQKIMKCGTGMVIYEYFKGKWIELNGNEMYSEEDCKSFLQQLTDLIKNYLECEKIKDLQNYFYQNILQTNWDLIDDNIFKYRGEIVFRQDFCLGLQLCMTESSESNEVKKAYLLRLRKVLFDDIIFQIKEMIGKEFKSVQKEIFGEEFNSALIEMSGEELKLALKVMLKISDEAWQYVSQSFVGIQCDYNSRDKLSMLYNVIQNALINANYQD